VKRPKLDWPTIGDIARLSNRQRQVLTGIACGMSDAEIGVTLDIARHTVVNHVRRIKFKLGIKDVLGGRRTRLAAVAAKAGLV
jgi:DNA-binding NarL/FixJ family response regulator